MSDRVFVATVSFKLRRLDIVDHVVVGIFSSREGAEEATENFTEGTLDVSIKADVLETSVMEYEIDRPIDAVPEDLDDGLPF